MEEMSSPVKSHYSNSDDEQKTWKSHGLHTASDSLSSVGNLIDDRSNQRKSAFLPYRPHTKVLTNLQRGNTEATFCHVAVTLSFHERAGQGELTEEIVSLEIERQKKCGINIDDPDPHGFTALHWAAFYGQLNSVKILVAANANVNAKAEDLITPLHLAACGGHHEVVRLLVERGAQPKHMDIMGNTALIYAAAGNHPHTCNELLASDPDMTVSNENGDTAYSLAIENGCVLAQAVLEHYMCDLLSL